MLPIPVVVGCTLLRELLRALAFPLWCLAYLAVRGRARRRSRDVLAASAEPAGEDLLAGLRRAHPRAPGAGAHLFLSAGEASGEAHAARVLTAVHARAPGRVRATCFGSRALAAAGGRVVVPLGEQAIMGVAGVLRALPFLVRALATFLRLLRSDPPQLVVLVDYPGLHLVMAEAARRHGVPVVHYIAPQYWAWAPWRMRRYRRCVDACLAILPFEPAVFRDAGVPCAYVGHPSLDQLAAEPPDPRRVAAERAAPALCLLPGSRRREIELHLPGMLQVVRRLRQGNPGLRAVIAHRDPRREPQIRAILQRSAMAAVEFEPGQVAEKLAGAQVVLAKSGTGSLEAALLGAPTVVVYRLPSAFHAVVARLYLSVPFFSAANLIAGRAVVPEACFAGETGWDWAVAEVEKLFHFGPERLACLDRLAEVQRRLGAPGASDRVAGFVLRALGVEVPGPA